MSQKTVSKLKKDLWKVFSLYIRTRDAVRTTGTTNTALCITCDRPYPVSAVGGLQAGHFLPGRHNSIKFNPQNCHAQCYGCNVMKMGNTVVYFRKMQKMYGDKAIIELEEKDKEIKQYKKPELLEMIVLYKDKLKALTNDT